MTGEEGAGRNLTTGSLNSPRPGGQPSSPDLAHEDNRAGDSVANVPLIDVVYRYTAADLQHYPSWTPPAGALVSFDVTDIDYVDLDQTTRAVHLAYGARRVQIIGNTSAATFFAAELRQRLDQMAS